MKFLKKLNRKIPDYIIYFIGFGVFGQWTLQLLVATSFLSFWFGIIMTVLLLISAIILGIKEILYWTDKSESDGWSDDLTNQL